MYKRSSPLTFTCAAAVPVGSRPPVIFITEHDVLKMGQPLYKIERQIVGTDRMFGDGAYIIYVGVKRSPGIGQIRQKQAAQIHMI